jgi:hypothetical protein
MQHAPASQPPIDFGTRWAGSTRCSDPQTMQGRPATAARYLPALGRLSHHAYEHVDAVMSTVDPHADSGRTASIQLRFGLHPAFRPGPAVRGDHLLYVGRVALEKRITDVLAAMSRRRWGRPPLIVGDGPARGRGRGAGAFAGTVRAGSLQAVRVRPAGARAHLSRGGVRRRAGTPRDVRPGGARGGGKRRAGRDVLPPLRLRAWPPRSLTSSAPRIHPT